MALSVIVLFYAIIKSTHLSSVTGATITTFSQDSKTSVNKALNLYENKFRIAFAIEGYLDGKLKIDPRYVRWIFRYVT